MIAAAGVQIAAQHSVLTRARREPDPFERVEAREDERDARAGAFLGDAQRISPRTLAPIVRAPRAVR